MSATRKVLISPDYGAGWSTWNDYAEDFLFDANLIRAVEAGKDLGSEDDPASPLGKFVARLRRKHGDGVYFYLGGARDLTVVEVAGRFRVREFDGSESIEYRGAIKWF